MKCETVKVMPWDESQGDFVEIDKTDFDEKKHTLYDETKKTEPKKAKSK